MYRSICICTEIKLYISITKHNISVNITTLKKCTQAVHEWFTTNGISLNPDKSEVIIMGTGSLKSLDAINKISVAIASIQLAT